MATEILDVRTTTRIETIDITALVRAAVKKAGVQEGLCCVFCPHTTAGLTIQENADPTVKADMMQHLSKLIPKEGFTHDEGNSDSHIKSSVVGASTTVLVENGRLLLGHWQAIFFCEFDGPRDRRVHIKVVPG